MRLQHDIEINNTVSLGAAWWRYAEHSHRTCDVTCQLRAEPIYTLFLNWSRIKSKKLPAAAEYLTSDEYQSHEIHALEIRPIFFISPHDLWKKLSQCYSIKIAIISVHAGRYVTDITLAQVINYPQMPRPQSFHHRGPWIERKSDLCFSLVTREMQSGGMKTSTTCCTKINARSWFEKRSERTSTLHLKRTVEDAED